MESQQSTMRQTGELTVTAIAAGVSVLLSWYQFFVRGNRQLGIFVGLWPPTILAFANHAKLQGLDRRLSSSGVERIRDSLERMVQNR